MPEKTVCTQMKLFLRRAVWLGCTIARGAGGYFVIFLLELYIGSSAAKTFTKEIRRADISPL